MSDRFSRKMTFTLKPEDKKKVRILFGFRITLWCVALGMFIYWAYWSFELYHQSVWDEHEYATALRPIFARSVFISLGAILVSFILYKISESIKKKAELESLEKGGPPAG